MFGKCCRIFSAISTFITVGPFFPVTDLVGRVGENGDCGCCGPLRRLKPAGWGWSAGWTCCSLAHAERRYLLQAQGPPGRSCRTHGPAGSSRRRETGSWEWKAWWQ